MNHTTEKSSILLIYTGGTIGMMKNPVTGALENFNFDQLLEYVPEIKGFIDFVRDSKRGILPADERKKSMM